MEPEIKWRLWVKDSERFCVNPLKDEVKLWFGIAGLAFIVIVNVIHYFWR